MDTVGHGGQLEDQSGNGKDQDGNPVIVGAVVDVDMAHFSESIRNSGQNEHHRESNDRNTPAGNEGKPHEFGAQDHLPADLEVEGQGTEETWHH